MFLAVASVFAACSDNDSSWNTAADVTVNMKPIENKQEDDDTLRVKEGVGIFNVPVVVTGEANGPVKVTVSVKETGTNPAKKDVNYMVTDTTVVISEGTGNIEIKAIDDADINEDRTFDVTIVSAEGAKIGDHPTTPVKLRDNDSEFYEKLQGNWNLNYFDGDGAAQSDAVTITGATDDADEDYNKTLYMSGIFGYKWLTAILSYQYDKNTNQGSLSFDQLGSYIAGGPVQFSTFTGNFVFYRYNGQTTPIVGTWSADFNTVTFDQSAVLQAYVFDATTGAGKGNYDFLQKITLTR